MHGIRRPFVVFAIENLTCSPSFVSCEMEDHPQGYGNGTMPRGHEINVELLRTAIRHRRMTHEQLAATISSNEKSMICAETIGRILRRDNKPSRRTIGYLERALRLGNGDLTSPNPSALVCDGDLYFVVYDLLDVINILCLDTSYWIDDNGKDVLTYAVSKVMPTSRFSDYALWKEGCLHLANRGELRRLDNGEFRIAIADFQEQLDLLDSRLQFEKNKIVSYAFSHPHQSAERKEIIALVEQRLLDAEPIRDQTPHQYPELGDFPVHAAYAGRRIHVANQLRNLHRMSQQVYARAAWCEGGNKDNPCPEGCRQRMIDMHQELVEMLMVYKDRSKSELDFVELLDLHVQDSIKTARSNDRAMRKRRRDNLAPVNYSPRPAEEPAKRRH